MKRLISIAVWAFGVATGHSQGFFHVMPNGYQTLEGNTASSIPFNIGDLGYPSIRYQQVYRGSSFSPIDEILLIDRISFRLDSVAGPSPPADIDVEVHFSITQRGVDGLSPVFAENIGADDTAVIPRSLQPMNPAWIPGQAPQPLHSWFLSTPFYYDPTQGNLLLDLWIYNARFTAPFDAVNTANDQVSRVWSSSVDATSGTIDTIGLVTGFHATVVPEPSTITLLVCGAAVLGFVLRRQAHRRK